MNRSGSLDRRLRYYVAVPLAGAAIFGGLAVYRAARSAVQFERERGMARLAQQVWRLHDLAERRFEAEWKPRRGRRAAGDAEKGAATLDGQLAALRDRTAASAFGPLGTDSAGALDGWIAAATRVGMAPTASTAGNASDADPPHHAWQLESSFGPVERAATRLILALSNDAQDGALRALFQELAWSLELRDAAANARLLVDANAGSRLVTASLITQIDFQQWRRQFAERQLLLTPLPERRSSWEARFADPSYVRADQLAEQWRNSATPGVPCRFSDGDAMAWNEATSARYELLATASEGVARDLRMQADAEYENALRKAEGFAAVLVLTLLSGVLLARFVLGRLHAILRRTLGSLRSGTSRIESVMNEMKSSTTRLSEAASQESSALQQTAASLQQLAAMNRENSRNAQASSEQMDRIAAIVRKSSESMRTLVGKMDEILEASVKTQKVIQSIREVAFQTNILALNASIEAARAGDAGTGFKVVAEEIRDLAKRASEASTETDHIIAQSHESIDQSAALCTRVDRTFREAEANADNCRELTNEIRTSSEEVSRGVDQIRKAAESMTGVTDQNVAISRENSETTDTLFAQARGLAQTIRRLEKLVAGAVGIPAG